MSDPLPVFRMPTCGRHFFSGHKWWCRKCDRATENEMRELAETWWRSQRE